MLSAWKSYHEGKIQAPTCPLYNPWWKEPDQPSLPDGRSWLELVRQYSSMCGRGKPCKILQADCRTTLHSVNLTYVIQKNICHFCTFLSLSYVLRIFEDRCQLGSHSAQYILHITIQFHHSINLSLITAFSQPGCHYMNSCARDEPWGSMRNGGPCCDSFDSWPARRSSWLKKMELSE